MHYARLICNRTFYKALGYKLTNVFTMANFVTKQGEEKVCDFSLFSRQDTQIQSIIVLNNQLNKALFSRTMKLTQNVVLADGGANQFFDSQFKDSDNIRAVVGNFGDIRSNVLEYYNEMKISVHYQSNNDYNDLAKSIQYCLNKGWRQIFCFGAFGGRMDQTLACMHYCQKYSHICPDMDIFLLGKSNLMYFLRKNQTYRIKMDDRYINKFGCGIISFGKAEHVETTGFRYNLGKQHKYKKIEWGQFISTSNQIIDDQCTIKSSHDIFFTATYSPKIAT